MTSRITGASDPARVDPRVQESNVHPISIAEEGALTWRVCGCQWLWTVHIVISWKSTSGCTCSHHYYFCRPQLSRPFPAESYTPSGKGSSLFLFTPNSPPFIKPALKDVRCIHHPVSHHQCLLLLLTLGQTVGSACLSTTKFQRLSVWALERDFLN